VSVLHYGDSHIAHGTQAETIAALLKGVAPTEYRTQAKRNISADFPFAHPQQWLDQPIGQAKPDLVILSFGSNDSAGHVNPEEYAKRYQQLIDGVRQRAPDASVLIVGPGDGNSIKGAGKGTDLPGLNTVIQVQQEVARKNGLDFFDLRQAMGGSGSIEQWHAAGLAEPDQFHFTSDGYKKIGQAIFQHIKPNLVQGSPDSVPADSPRADSPPANSPRADLPGGAAIPGGKPTDAIEPVMQPRPDAGHGQGSDGPVHISPESRRTIRRINHRMPNNHYGKMSRGEVADQLPGYRRREHAPGEDALERLDPEAAERGLRADRVSAHKNMLAGIFSPDAHEPYHTIRRRSDQSYAVGRYGIHSAHMHRIFAHALPKAILEQLGHPPDYSKLSSILKDNPALLEQIQQNVQAAIKEGDIPSAMADRFKSPESLASLADFTHKLGGKPKPGQGELSKEDLQKNLPQAAQDELAQQESERGMKAGATPGEVALAHQIGKDTTQLTDAEKGDNQPLMEAAGKQYALGMANERMSHGDNFHWSTTAAGQTIALLATQKAREIGTVGDCARGPRLVFRDLGYHLPRAVATVQGRMLEESGLFDVVPAWQARAGDYGYRHWSPETIMAKGGIDKGDSFIVRGRDSNGSVLGANDHLFTVPPDGGYYVGLTYLRPNEKFYQLYGKSLMAQGTGREIGSQEGPAEPLRAGDGGVTDGQFKISNTAATRDLTVHQRALLDALAGPESTGRYDELFAGKKLRSYAWHPGINPLTKKSDSGRYMFLRTTWNQVANELDQMADKLNNPELRLRDFTPESQDRAAWHLASKAYRLNTHGHDLERDLEAGRFRPEALQGTWVSIRGDWYNKQYIPALKNAIAYHRRNLAPPEVTS
jgi:lysophospholipase L1-like esterase/muramidase (phage lysozyme)